VFLSVGGESGSSSREILVLFQQGGRETERRHIRLLSKENQVKIPELGNKDMFVATQLNLKMLAMVLGSVLFSF
jgi:hypothetical protein